MARLTEYGFERRNRTELIEYYNTKFRQKFGNDIDLSDDTLAGLFRAILAEARLEVEKLLEDVYYARTFNGAEGIYLDDSLGYYGKFREGQTAGSGVVQIHYDSTTPDDQQLTSADTFSGDNGISYQVSSPTLLNQSVSGFLLDLTIDNRDNFPLGVYTFSVRNTETSDIITEDFTLSSYNQASIDAFLNNVRDLWIENTSDNEAFIRVDGEILYVGYNTANQYVTLTEPTYFSMSPENGAEYWSSVEVVAEEVGYNPLLRGGINSYDSSFPGFIEAINIFEFNPGSENQSDAEFRIESEGEELSAPAGTREGVRKAVADLEGVQGVRIYANPTLENLPEADALTFNVVVRGGTDTAIAQAIYDSKPIGRNTSGLTSITVETEDNDTEVIRFTRSTSKSVDLRITYLLNNNVPLSMSERNLIEANLNELFNNTKIGGTVYNTQMNNAVLSALSSERIIDVSIEVKNQGDSDANYTKSNVTPLFSEYPVINNVEFVREL